MPGHGTFPDTALGRVMEAWHVMHRMRLLPAVALLAALALPRGAGGADWPQFRGPSRDGTSPEAGLAASWPEGGPRLVATLDGVGEGFSSPVVAGGGVYVSGRAGNDLHVYAFDLEGRPRWQAACGSAYGGGWPGARSTPTFDAGTLYVLTGNGRLTALAADRGAKIWSLDLLETFGGKRPTYGVAESVLVVGDRLVCTPGGPDACLAALDTKTGRTVWTSKGLSDGAAYASPILVEQGGVRQVVTLTARALVGVAFDDGRPLWRFAGYFDGLMAENVLTPVFRDGVFFTEGGHYSSGGAVRVVAAGGAFTPEPLWKKSEGATHTGGYVERGGFLYGETGRGWGCIELVTGQVRYREKAVRVASTLWADGRFYCLAEKGTAYLVDADPTACRIVGQVKIPNAGNQTWAYPAISGGRLYVRRLEKVFVYDIAK